MGAEERRARGAMARITEGGWRGGGERKKNWIGGAYKRERDPSLNRLHPPPFLPPCWSHAGFSSIHDAPSFLAAFSTDHSAISAKPFNRA